VPPLPFLLSVGVSLRWLSRLGIPFIFPSDGSVVVAPLHSSRGSSGRPAAAVEFPSFIGTIEALGLPVIRPSRLRFLAGRFLLQHMLIRSLMAVVLCHQGPGEGPSFLSCAAAHGLLALVAQDLPGSWGILCKRAPLFDPNGTSTSSPVSCVPVRPSG